MINIEIVGKFYDNHSLSIINRNLLFELLKSDKYKVTISCLDELTESCTLTKDELKIINNLEKSDIGDIDIQFRHFYPPIWRWPTSDKTKLVFIQGWEFSRTPSEWQYKFETFADHVVTYSKWSKDRFVEAGLNPKKISSINPGYNPTIFNTNNREPRDKRKFTFTFVGCGQYRKGIDILITAYQTTFKKADQVKLIIKDAPRIYGENNLLSEILRLQYIHNTADIEFIDNDLSEKEMANLYKRTDVLVHPYRGEGFGMHVQEAMACGAFPLVTGNGATDDFVNESCGLRINSIKRFFNITDPKIFAVKPGDSLSNMGAHAWIIEPNDKDLMQKMSFLYHHHEKDNILDRVNNAKLTTWNLMAKNYEDVIDKLFLDIRTPIRLR